MTFYVTSDATMNSFWVPQLSGQIYAMPGMSSQINFMASSTGKFYGSSANISGSGFASMHFLTIATSHKTFDSWVASAQKSKNVLNQTSYTSLDQPSSNNPVSYYSDATPGLYSSIVNKYLGPGGQMSGMMGMQ